MMSPCWSLKMILRSCLRAGAGIAVAMFVAASLSPVSAVAQEKKFSESHIAAARELVLATKALDTFDDILPMLAEQTKTIFIQADPFRSDEVTSVTNDVALKMAAKRSELNQAVYENWAALFTEDELKQLAAFYKTPLGQKLAAEGPKVTVMSIGAARQWQDKISTEMVGLVKEELAKNDADANATAPAANAAPAGNAAPAPVPAPKKQ